ncbi:MAG: tryptophan 7-halogenase [Actinomycetota bacterium]|nr:tryptophan 7-halogenase [Actinomycetota bacterium]
MGHDIGHDIGHDAIVIGAGPAGSSCAATLAAAGRSVVLLERAQHPRFHIGESLLPYGTPLLDQLGVLEEITTGPFVHKPGAHVADTQGRQIRAAFSDLPDGQVNYAFNVERSAFDAVLSAAAARAGAEVVDDAEVAGVIWDGGRAVGITYRRGGQTHEARTRFVVDASGRAGVVARDLKLRRMNPKLNNVAVFQQYLHPRHGVNLSDEGYIVFTSHADGWVWCIPLGPDKVSIGCVTPAGVLKGSQRQELFQRHLARSPLIHASVADAVPVFDQLKVESDFCYHSEQLAGPGFFLVGDAGCFVDPLFSGGVLLGMTGGIKAAEAIDTMLSGADEVATAAWYENYCKTGYDMYFRLVYAFYYGCGGNIPALFKFLPGGFEYVLQLVAGDFWGSTGGPVVSYLRSERAWDTFERPFTLAGVPSGKP